MKKLVFILCAAVALFSMSQMAAADTVTLVGGYGPFHTGNGGEFTMMPSGSTLPGYIALYDQTKTSNFEQAGTFQTFCIEWNEHVSSGGTYNAILNSNAIQGGVGPAGDPISVGTAYLYYEFAKGTLTYNYGANRTDTADQLQKAIWFLEGEISDPGANAYLTLVNGLFGNPMADANGAYGVYALNLYNADGSLAQDVLIVTTPEPMTMIIFGLGLIGLAGLRRKE
jgi:hypothetical protein